MGSGEGGSGLGGRGRGRQMGSVHTTYANLQITRGGKGWMKVVIGI